MCAVLKCMYRFNVNKAPVKNPQTAHGSLSHAMRLFLVLCRKSNLVESDEAIISEKMLLWKNKSQNNFHTLLCRFYSRDHIINMCQYVKTVTSLFQNSFIMNTATADLYSVTLFVSIIGKQTLFVVVAVQNFPRLCFFFD